MTISMSLWKNARVATLQLGFFSHKPKFFWNCCNRKSRAAYAQSFALWQQATIEFTCHDHYYCLFVPYICMVLFFTHIPFVVNHTINATPPEKLQQTDQKNCQLGHNVQTYWLVYAVTASFNTIIGQMIWTSQRKKMSITVMLQLQSHTQKLSLPSFIMKKYEVPDKIAYKPISWKAHFLRKSFTILAMSCHNTFNIFSCFFFNFQHISCSFYRRN